MTQHIHERESTRIDNIEAADETRTGVLRQIVNGVGGLLLLLVLALVIVLLVLWKAP